MKSESPPPNRLALIKKIAKSKKRKAVFNTSANKLLREVAKYSKTEPDRTTI